MWVLYDFPTDQPDIFFFASAICSGSPRLCGHSYVKRSISNMVWCDWVRVTPVRNPLFAQAQNANRKKKGSPGPFTNEPVSGSCSSNCSRKGIRALPGSLHLLQRIRFPHLLARGKKYPHLILLVFLTMHSLKSKGSHGCTGAKTGD